MIWWPHLFASYHPISWFLKVVSVPRDLQETSSVSYPESQERYLNSCHLPKSWCQTKNTLAKVPLLRETNTWQHFVCVCTDTHLWNERSVRHEPCWNPVISWTSSLCPDLISCCFPSTAESARCWSCGPGETGAAAKRWGERTWEWWAHLLGSSGSCLWIQENPFFPMQRGLYHRHEEGKGRLKQYNDILVACHKAEGRSLCILTPGSGLRWQLSTSGQISL